MKILGWDFNSKMLFNPDPPKQAKEAFFSKKKNLCTNPYFNPYLFFNNLLIEQAKLKISWFNVRPKTNTSVPCK